MQKEKIFFQKCAIMATVSMLTLAIGCGSPSETLSEESTDIIRNGIPSTEYVSEETFDTEFTMEESKSSEITTEEFTMEEVSTEESDTEIISESATEESELISETSSSNNSAAVPIFIPYEPNNTTAVEPAIANTSTA